MYPLGNVGLLSISDDVVVTVERTVVLICAGHGSSAVEVSWMHNGLVIASDSLRSTSEMDFNHGATFVRHSYLQICNVGESDAGAYTCVVTNGAISVNSSAQVVVLCKQFSYVP